MDERKLVMEDKIYAVLALLILFSIIPKPSLNILFIGSYAHIWLCQFSGSIFKFLYFTESSTKSMKMYDGSSKNFKINPILDHLNSQFKILHIPRYNISTDETLTPWKRYLCFKEYFPLKSSQFGVKTFELCESSTA
jgi:hypothetical protein